MCSQTRRQIDTAIWGVKCKWMQSDVTDRKEGGRVSSCWWGGVCTLFEGGEYRMHS